MVQLDTLENNQLAKRSLGLREKTGSGVTERLKSETLNFAFKLHPYARYKIKASNQPGSASVPFSSLLKTGQMMRLWHHEATSYMGASITPVVHSDKTANDKTANVALLPTRDGTVENDDTAHSTTVWQLESVNPGQGHVAQWSSKYRVKHTMTMKYLAVGDYQVDSLNKDDETKSEESPKVRVVQV